MFRMMHDPNYGKYNILQRYDKPHENKSVIKRFFDFIKYNVKRIWSNFKINKHIEAIVDKVAKQVIEEDKNIWVYAIGKAAKVNGFIEYQIRKMKF